LEYKKNQQQKNATTPLQQSKTYAIHTIESHDDIQCYSTKPTKNRGQPAGDVSAQKRHLKIPFISSHPPNTILTVQPMNINPFFILKKYFSKKKNSLSKTHSDRTLIPLSCCFYKSRFFFS